MTTKILAVLIVVSGLVLAILSLRGDSLTSDEVPHISAGYSYLTQNDMRLNPEHPPLIKDLAALPLLFQKINFDTTHSSWADEINGQWTFGHHFFYEIGNNPDKIAFASRLAVLLLYILLCFLVFKWAKARYGNTAALTALFLTALSPNILAHARYVTTDIAAALGFVGAIYFFIRFLENPSKKNILYAGLVFGLAELLKFSLILLLPFLTFILIVFCFVKKRSGLKINISRYIASLLLIFIIGYALVGPVYYFHIKNYPIIKQQNEIAFNLQSFKIKPAVQMVVAMAGNKILRPYAEYLLGLFMVFTRAAGGNTTYFLGEVSAQSWRSYFPMVYLLKEPIPLLLLLLISLAILIWQIKNSFKNHRILKLISENFTEFACLTFIIFYWLTSISGNLNIGLRHVLPTFPFIYFLISGQVHKWLSSSSVFNKFIKTIPLALIFFWYAVESFTTFPHYLAYFNELAGGPANGYKYAVDSNLDWGQDLKRLKEFVDKNQIEKISVDYFGGGDPGYYLGNKFERFDIHQPEQHQKWLAVSATFLQNGRATPAKGYRDSTTFYNWLNNYEPVAKIGYSIFVYKLD